MVFHVLVVFFDVLADVRSLLVRRRGFVLVVNESRRAERRLPRGEDEEHILAFELRVALDDRAVREIDRDAIEQPFSVRRVGDLAAAEHDRHFDFAAVEKQPFGHLRFDFVVVRVDLGSQFHLAQFEVFLLLARVFVFLRLLVLQSTVITNATDRRNRGGRDLDEVEPLRAREIHRFLGRHDAELGPLIDDHANGADADLVVDA